MSKTMKTILGIVTIATTIASPTLAAQPLYLAYPPNNHRTTSDRIFFIGTAPPSGRVLVNGRTIQRSPAGHFAPSFPLRIGDNFFTFRYRNQQRRIKVTRLSTQPSPPVGLTFGKDSLTPRVDIARMSGEAICFSAIAPANATVNVKLANQTIALTAQPARVILPPNSAALVGQNLPNSVTTQNIPRSSNYQGCATAKSPGELGRPEFQLTINGKTISEIGQGNIKILSPTQLEIAEVIVDGGIARTGPGTNYSRLTPLPKGTQASITGREGDWVRL
ncbi:MAG TPA: N-acetylmuramoyl-L-alanine amidase, partial [Cyanobacteria bacterium UBA11368]|nr:N-acetylmuramoyl-L-alanine amidase [Cyanobacteria bacterium UBA11368]